MGKMIAISTRLGSIRANNEGGMYAYRSSKAALKRRLLLGRHRRDGGTGERRRHPPGDRWSWAHRQR
jgi:hypothetical protein